MDINSLLSSSNSVGTTFKSSAAAMDGKSQFSPFTEEELAEIARLKKRDREVRAHEQAHQAAAGQYAGAPRYTYQRGPDGRNYAIGGEVSIDTSTIPGDPEATLRKAQQLQRAALAPAEPSSQDQSVAAEAASMAMKARIELARQERQSRDQQSQPDENTPSAGTETETGFETGSVAGPGPGTGTDNDAGLLLQRFNTRPPPPDRLNIKI